MTELHIFELLIIWTGFVIGAKVNADFSLLLAKSWNWYKLKFLKKHGLDISGVWAYVFKQIFRIKLDTQLYKIELFYKFISDWNVRGWFVGTNITEPKILKHLLHFGCGWIYYNGWKNLYLPFYFSALINIPGFGVVQVNIHYLCDCECTSVTQKSSSKCSDKGTLQCSICKCNEGVYGDICQCDKSNLVGGSLNDTFLPCLSDPNDNTTKCSNQGSCVCGQCVCNKEEVGANISLRELILLIFQATFVSEAALLIIS